MYNLFQIAGGWTLLGRVVDPSSEGRIIIQDAALVHDWGTDKGVGGLLLEPLEKTVLHDFPNIEYSDGIAIEDRNVRFQGHLGDAWISKLRHKTIPNPDTMRGWVKILQLAGGWTVVGKLHEMTEDSYHMSNALIIHEWGAPDRGLARLSEGPTQSTVGYPFPSKIMRINRHSVRFAIDAVTLAWAERLGI